MVRPSINWSATWASSLARGASSSSAAIASAVRRASPAAVGVGQQACHVGESADEGLDAFLALPVEEDGRAPHAHEGGDRTEEGGQHRRGDQPQRAPGRRR